MNTGQSVPKAEKDAERALQEAEIGGFRTAMVPASALAILVSELATLRAQCASKDALLQKLIEEGRRDIDRRIDAHLNQGASRE